MKKQVTINTQKTIGTPNDKMWGIFYEEINHAGDGGLYAELIKNRNFADSDIPEGTLFSGSKFKTLKGWTVEGNISLDDALPGWSLVKFTDASANMEKIYENPRNPLCASQLKLSFNGKVRLVNSGYWGINGESDGYHGFIIAKSSAIDNVTLGLMRKNGALLGSAKINGINETYTKFEFDFNLEAKDSDARFFIEIEGSGEIYFDFCSLFPNNTYQNKKYGFRQDLMEMLKNLRPGFLRFPGGCVVEGFNLENAIHWKNTIGPIENRPGHFDLWGYRCTDGLGMMEFCLLGEALGAELMYVCNCGMACQARKGEFADKNELMIWLQDALDAIEYMIGSTDTKWGAKRAEDGHPKPFNLRYIEIGNENSGPDYEARFPLFRNAIREKYPQLEIIADVPLNNEDYDLVDDHYYTAPHAFPYMSERYKGEGGKVYVGEYACNQEVGYGNLLGAISDATFMVAMENCCDRVRIASYAPLFCNDNDRRWPVNLINFDKKFVFGIPSYYVQKLFAQHRVAKVVENNCEFIKGAISNLYVTSGINQDELIIKAANFGPESINTDFICDKIKKGVCEISTVTSEKPEDTNSLLYPLSVSDVNTTAYTDEGSLSIEFAPWSFSVIRIKIS